MEPSKQTIGALHTRYAVDWFAKVGTNDLNDVDYAQDWTEAERLCSESRYENIKIEAANSCVWLSLRAINRAAGFGTRSRRPSDLLPRLSLPTERQK